MADRPHNKGKRAARPSLKKHHVTPPRASSSRSKGISRPISSHISFNPDWFTSAESSEFYMSFKPLNHMQFYFDFKGYTLNLARIPTWFGNLRLTHFVTLHYPTYDEMTKMFYANFDKSSPPHCFRTNVCGTPIFLNEDTISDIFQIPDDGLDITVKELSLHNFLEEICENPARNSIAKPKYHELNAETRLLFLYFSHFLSKQGNHTDFPLTEQRLVYCIKKGLMVDFPRLIIHTMIKRRAHRPFHMFLTPIFTYFRIPLYGESILKDEQCINISKIVGPLHIQRTADSFILPPEPRAIPRVEIDDDDEELDLKEYIDDRIVGLQLELNNRIDAVEANITHQISGLMDYLKSLPFPPPGADM